MKVVKVLAIITAAVLLLIGSSYLFYKPLYYRIFYPWNRITGTVRVTIDGETYALKDSDITGSHENADIGIGFSKKDNGARLSVRGGDYGPYNMLIRVDGVDLPLEVVAFQHNWWNVTEFDLDISIDSTAEKITFTSSAKVLNEEGEKIPQNTSTESSFSSENIIHYIVSL